MKQQYKIRYNQYQSPPKQKQNQTLQSFINKNNSNIQQKYLKQTQTKQKNIVRQTRSNTKPKLQLKQTPQLDQLFINFTRIQTTKVDQIQSQQKDKLQFFKLQNKNQTLYQEQSNTFQNQAFLKKGGAIFKRILDIYNLKSIKKRNYQKLINTFGLRIQSIKYQQNKKHKSKKSKVSITNRQISQQKALCQKCNDQNTPQKPKQQLIQASYLQYFKKTFKNEKKKVDEQKQQLRISKQVKPMSTQIKRTTIMIRRPSTGYNRQVLNKQLIATSPKKKITDKVSFESRLNKYRQFLFLINYSNQIYRNLQINNYQFSLKYYVGRGNNANLIHSLMKKRFWITQTDKIEQAHFIWTQIKNQSIFKKQQNNQKNYIIRTQSNSRNVRTERSLVIQSPTKRGARIHEPKNPYLKLLTNKEYTLYFETSKLLQSTNKNDFKNRVKYLKKLKISPINKIQITHNHLPQNGLLGNKKAMFYCLRQYYKLMGKDIFSVVPLTFHIQQGTKDDQFKKFIIHYNEKKKLNKPNIWIIKPGEQTNRGNGISCSSKLDQIKKKISVTNKQQKIKRTYIIQSYLTKPLLYCRRKFDIRAYMLITSNNGIIKGYWYQQGYIRTSSCFFDLQELSDPMIHLTNDAIQKFGDQYGKYESGNKLSYYQLQRYLESIGSKFNFYQMAYPEMRRIATDSIRSTFQFLDYNKKQNNFQIFGLDFMIDQNFKVWLIEINTNPCLELSCGILERLIPHMVENAFRIGLDPIYPPPSNYMPSKKYNISENALIFNKFQLIFDQIRDGQQLQKLYKYSNLLQTIGIVQEDKQQYDNQGQIIEILD